MNLSEFINEDNLTFERFDVNGTGQQQQQSYEFYVAETVYIVLMYVSAALGIPGNILSAIVWLRLHVASKNSSAVYLAALAINDLVFLLNLLGYRIIKCVGWLCVCHFFLIGSTVLIEPALVLGFSVERLIAISCPLQVRCTRDEETKRKKNKKEVTNSDISRMRPDHPRRPIAAIFEI